MYRVFSWTAVILWMVLIFSLSHQPVAQSSELSVGITEVIVEKVEKVSPNVEFNIGSFHHIVRKNAHFFHLFSAWFSCDECFEKKWNAWLSDDRTFFIRLCSLCYIR